MNAMGRSLFALLLVGLLASALAACAASSRGSPTTGADSRPGPTNVPASSGSVVIPSLEIAESTRPPTKAVFDGEWTFTNPEVDFSDFTICEATCIELLGKQSNLLGANGSLVVTANGVQMNGVLWSIKCTGGGAMSHRFDMFLMADGPNRLEAHGVAMPEGGCAGRGPATVDFIAIRRG
jgi:hypothetical protein